jgi:hypothetical protein
MLALPALAHPVEPLTPYERQRLSAATTTPRSHALQLPISQPSSSTAQQDGKGRHNNTSDGPAARPAPTATHVEALRKGPASSPALAADPDLAGALARVAELECSRERDAAELNQLRCTVRNLTDAKRRLEGEAVAYAKRARTSPSRNAVLRPFALRIGYEHASTPLTDISKHKMQSDIANKKWREYTTAVAAPYDGGCFDATAAAIQKGLLSVVMTCLACANQYEHSMRLAHPARRNEIKAARLGVKTAQKRLAGLAAVCKYLESTVATMRAGDATMRDTDFARRVLVGKAAELFIERLSLIADMQHLALEYDPVPFLLQPCFANCPITVPRVVHFSVI